MLPAGGSGDVDAHIKRTQEAMEVVLDLLQEGHQKRLYRPVDSLIMAGILQNLRASVLAHLKRRIYGK